MVSSWWRKQTFQRAKGISFTSTRSDFIVRLGFHLIYLFVDFATGCQSYIETEFSSYMRFFSHTQSMNTRKSNGIHKLLLTIIGKLWDCARYSCKTKPQQKKYFEYKNLLLNCIESMIIDSRWCIFCVLNISRLFWIDAILLSVCLSFFFLLLSIRMTFKWVWLHI